MQRRAFNFRLFALLSVCVVLPYSASAAKSLSEDELGCHQDDITESYICDSGPLLGREFLSLSEAQDALQALKAKTQEQEAESGEEELTPSEPAPVAQPENTEHLRVISWNIKALAGEGSDYDRAALVLADADVMVLQEVDLHGQGKGFMNVIANLIQAKTQEKVCRAWVQGSNGERQTYGFLWKEKTVGYLDSDGEMKESCGDTALTIRQLKKTKLASQGTFYFKAQRKMFVLGTLFMDRQPKSPDKDVNEIFKSLDEGKWPVLLAGDFKMGAGNSAFNNARKMGFHSAVSGKKNAWENVWYRGAGVIQAGPVDLSERFSDARHEDIKKSFANIFPIMAEFNLREESKDSVSIVPKSKPKKKSTKGSRQANGN